MRLGGTHQKRLRLLAQGYSALNENQAKGSGNTIEYLRSPQHLDLIIKSIIVDPKYLGRGSYSLEFWSNRYVYLRAGVKDSLRF